LRGDPRKEERKRCAIVETIWDKVVVDMQVA